MGRAVGHQGRSRGRSVGSPANRHVGRLPSAFCQGGPSVFSTWARGVQATKAHVLRVRQPRHDGQPPEQPRQE
eukprot:3111422-Pyramimonas_sp.AAC.1